MDTLCLLADDSAVFLHINSIHIDFVCVIKDCDFFSRLTAFKYVNIYVGKALHKIESHNLV